MSELDTKSDFGARQATLFEKLSWRVSDWKGFSQERRKRLRKRYARPVKGPFDTELDGMKFRLYPAENYCDRVIFGRHTLPEREEHEALVPLIKPGLVFVDIGANVGSYSIFVGTRSKGDCTLLAFEPHPRTFQKLLFNLQANGLPIANVLNCGVAGQADTLALWSDGGSNIGHTSMLKEGTANAKLRVDVPVVPLLDALDERGIKRIDLLKIDIEGFEDRALSPFFDAAPHSLLPGHILIEIAHAHLWERDLMGQLTGLGYQEIFATRENRLLKRIN